MRKNTISRLKEVPLKYRFMAVMPEMRSYDHGGFLHEGRHLVYTSDWYIYNIQYDKDCRNSPQIDDNFNGLTVEDADNSDGFMHIKSIYMGCL